MQAYDFIMLSVLVGLTLFGYAKGMAWQVAYLASFVASYFVAVRFADQFAPMFGDSAPWNKFVAMAMIYAVTSLGIWLVFRVVRRGIDKVKLEGFDRQMGAIIGFARGVLWCVGITFFAVGLLPASQKEKIIASRSGHYISIVLDKADAVAPPEIHQVIGPYLDQIEQRLAPNGQTPPDAAWPNLGAQPPAAPGWPPSANEQPNTGWPSPSGGAPAQPTGWPQPSSTGNGWPQ